MYLIESGRVELVKSPGPTERITATLDAGDFFGELAVLEEGAVHLVSARAVGDVRVLPIDGAALDYILRVEPALALLLLQKLAGRLRGLDEQALRAHEAAAGALAAEKQPLPAAGEVVAAVANQAEAKNLGAVVRAELVLDGTGERFPIRLDRESRVGRFDPISKQAPDIDLHSVDSGFSLSRRHATFWFEGHRLLLREESGVTNGTFIDGKRLRPVKPQVVEHGEKIRFGLVDFDLELDRAEVEDA